MSKQRVEPVNIAGVMLKIVLIAMFFSVDTDFLSSFSEEQLVGFVSGVLSSICSKRRRNGAIVED